VDLNRTTAIIDYQRVLDTFPTGKYAYNCEWRISWVAYVNRQPDADDRLTTFLLKYPVSANAVDAIYWLGRNASAPETPRMPAAYTRKQSIASRNLFWQRGSSAPCQAGPG